MRALALRVPNAEDGVAGVTQDAVLPGERHVYRFRAEQVGTFWYHTHQVSSKEVRRGLFGVIVIEPRQAQPGVDMVLAAHTFDGIPTLNADEGAGRRKIPAGAPVRLRLVNTDSFQHTFTVSGTPFRVLAIDGTDLHEPGELENVALLLAAGGRMDVGFVQPPNGVRVGIERTETAIGLGPRGGPPPGEAAPTGVRPAHLWDARADAVRPRVDLRPAIRAEGYEQAGLLRRPPRQAMGDQRQHLPRRPRVRRRGRRPRRGDRHERLEGNPPPDAPARPPPARPQP